MPDSSLRASAVPYPDEVGHERAVAMFKAATPPVGSPICEWRDGFEKMCESFDVPADLVFETKDANGIPALQVTAPGASTSKVILHFHSGGYVMGSSRAYRNFAARLSAASGASVVLPDYRLAPEHPYPAPVEDAATAYQWALRHWAATNIIVSGDSAGGGLALATLLGARDAGREMPAAAIAISPLLDLAGDGASMQSNASHDPLIDRTMVVEMGKLYIGSIDPHQHPLASPLWGEHHGLPPLLLMSSDAEVLRDDAVRMAESVRRAGGSVELSLAPGMVHVWTLFPFLREARRSMEIAGGFARRHLRV